MVTITSTVSAHSALDPGAGPELHVPRLPPRGDAAEPQSPRGAADPPGGAEGFGEGVVKGQSPMSLDAPHRYGTRSAAGRARPVTEVHPPCRPLGRHGSF